MMKNLLVLIIALVFIGGCATAKQTYTADGQQGHSINCSGSALNWGMCYEKAGELCGENGYEVLEKTGDQGAMATAGQFGLFAGSIINRSMIIKCKKKGEVQQPKAMPVAKPPEPFIQPDQPYKGIKGIVLTNGSIIKGRVISMDPDSIKIRTNEGNILSYSFKYEVQKLITD